MKERRVVITGAGGISPLGTDWESVKAKILSQTNAVKVIDDWADITGLKTRAACPAVPFALDPVKYGRKATRSMGRVGIMAVRSAEVALTDAGLIDRQDFLSSGEVGIAYGSSAGTPSAIGDVASLILKRTTLGMNANTYVRMMSHTAPVNIGIFCQWQRKSPGPSHPTRNISASSGSSVTTGTASRAKRRKSSDSCGALSVLARTFTASFTRRGSWWSGTERR